MSSSSGRMNASTLTRLVQRFLKCQDHAELNRLQAQDHLFKQLLLLRSEEEQASKNAAEIMDYLASLGPRKVCQYQVRNFVE